MFYVMKENLFDIGAQDFVVGIYETKEQAQSVIDTYLGHPTYDLLYIIVK